MLAGFFCFFARIIDYKVIIVLVVYYVYIFMAVVCV